MKYDCSIIQDLLPLYKDGICSDSSRKMIEEHIAECHTCKKMLDDLNDIDIDEMIIKEKENVIESQSRFFKRKSAIAGSVIAAIFALPILICLIADLATGNGFGWFFIVFAAMLIPSSLFVVPFMVPKYKMFATMTSFTASIILLLAVCCIYNGGNWFIVAASSVLFGLTVIFSPFIACRRPIKNYLKSFKGLAVMAADTFTFYLMIICIGITIKSAGYFSLAFSISVPLILLVWGVFLIIRYLPFNGLVKVGAVISLISLFVYFGTNLMIQLSLKSSSAEIYVSQTPNMIVMIFGLIIGVILTVIGLLVGTKRGEKNEKIK